MADKTTQPTIWLLEKDLHEEDFYLRFDAAAKKNNIEYVLLDVPGNMALTRKQESDLTEEFHNRMDNLLVPYGSVQFIQWVSKIGPTIARLLGPDLDTPSMALFFDLRKMAWSHYTSYWGKYLLSRDHVVTTYAELIRRKEWFYAILGQDLGKGRCLFVRPAANDKTFTGRVVYQDQFDIDIKRMGYSFDQSYPPHLEVVVAGPKDVSIEWRFAVVDREVVASSQYNVDGLLEEQEGCPAEALDLAKELANHAWQPQDAYCLDICSSNGQMYLLEIGSINSAGWYCMDIERILLALERWKENEDES